MVETRAVLDGGKGAVIARFGLSATQQNRRTAAIVERGKKTKGVKAAVHAATQNARAVVHHCKVAKV